MDPMLPGIPGLPQLPQIVLGDQPGQVPITGFPTQLGSPQIVPTFVDPGTLPKQDFPKVQLIGDIKPTANFPIEKTTTLKIVPSVESYKSRPNITNVKFIKYLPPVQKETPIVSNTKVSLDKKKMTFTIEGISYRTANTLRRTIITEVPTLTIEDVIFVKNQSSFHEEVIANRLGLIPLNLDPEKYLFKNQEPDPTKPDLKSFEKLTFTQVNNTKSIAPAISNFIIDEQGNPVSKDGIIIAPLKPNAELSFKARAYKGIGRINTKWSAGKAWYNEETSLDPMTKRTKIKFNFTVESQSTLTASRILFKALQILSEPQEAVPYTAFEEIQQSLKL